MEQKFCQSCGMPLNPEVLGTEKDGSKNEEINQCAQFVDEFNKGSEVKMTKEEAIANMKQFFPMLKRWKQ